MLSKNQIKLITSLSQKKYRNQHQLFVAEGIKVVGELIEAGFELEKLYCTENYGFINSIDKEKVEIISENELKKISSLKSPNQVLALFNIPQTKKINEKGLIVALDDINDPGNLGTIIRLCDWFGVKQIVCSTNTVDCFNVKVVQATMGSLARVNVFYTDLEEFLNRTTLPIYGAVMNGKNVYSASKEENAILVMGNEANGISETIEKLITHTITIPKYNKDAVIDSLNVATATAILLNEFRRN